jgi:hypothetical protein
MNLSAASAVAQQELGRVGFELAGRGAFEDPPAGAEDVSVGVLAFESRALAPISLDARRTLLSVGANYTLLSPQIAGAEVESRQAHEVGVTVAFRHAPNDQWSVSLLANPSLASDFRALSGDAFNIRAAAVAQVELGPQTQLGFGVTASYDLGRLLPLPLLSFRWRPLPTTTLTLAFPEGIRFSHVVDDRLDLGASLGLGGSRYQLDASTNAIVADTLRTTTVDVGPRVAVRLFAMVWLEAYAGWTLFRNFEAFEETGSEARFAGQVENAFIVRAAIVLRAPREPDPEPELPGDQEAGEHLSCSLRAFGPCSLSTADAEGARWPLRGHPRTSVPPVRPAASLLLILAGRLDAETVASRRRQGLEAPR